MTNFVEMGKRIKSLRERANLNQKAVADYLSLDQSMVSKIEKGERKITSDVIEKLARLFCCSPDFILCRRRKLRHVVSFQGIYCGGSGSFGRGESDCTESV